MNKKRILSLALMMCLALLPNAALAADTPSSWAAEQVNMAIAANLVPQNLQSQYTQAITRADFAALAVTLHENVTGKEIAERLTFSDTQDVNVEKAAAIGVVSGTGNNNFSPGTALTREQAATMLSRLSNVIGKPITQQTAMFSDNSSISSWALEAVGQMQASGIMSGVGNNNFAPQGDYTREQSIVTILRLYDVVKPANGSGAVITQERIDKWENIHSAMMTLSSSIIFSAKEDAINAINSVVDYCGDDEFFAGVKSIAESMIPHLNRFEPNSDSTESLWQELSELSNEVSRLRDSLTAGGIPETLVSQGENIRAYAKHSGVPDFGYFYGLTQTDSWSTEDNAINRISAGDTGTAIYFYQYNDIRLNASEITKYTGQMTAQGYQYNGTKTGQITGFEYAGALNYHEYEKGGATVIVARLNSDGNIITNIMIVVSVPYPYAVTPPAAPSASAPYAVTPSVSAPYAEYQPAQPITQEKNVTTGSTPKSYTKYPGVPDFGAFVGRPSAREINVGGSTVYYYIVFDEVLSAYFSVDKLGEYTNLLMSEGFVYYADALEDGTPAYISANFAVTVSRGFEKLWGVTEMVVKVIVMPIS
jgi:hypothetical protein